MKLQRKWVDTIGVPPKSLRSPTDFGPWPCLDWTPESGENPPSTIPGHVKIRIELIDFTGFMVQHCHVLDHEDFGMMQLIEIYDPNDTTQTFIPGTSTKSRCTDRSSAVSNSDTSSNPTDESNGNIIIPLLTHILLFICCFSLL